MVRVVIHSNPHLANQEESACWLSEGFARCGVDGVIVSDVQAEGDIHVVQGPHYAYSYWLSRARTHRVLFLNRCFYGHARFDLSIGWLNPDGTRDFRNAEKTEPNGTLPELKPKKPQQICAVVFGDYGEDSADLVAQARQKYGRVYFRPHPADPRDGPALSPKWPLDQVWEIADVAVGGRSTVLVEAAINGLHVETTDPRHVVQGAAEDREGWLTRLSWAQWSHEQIRSGAFWSHLK